MRLNLIKQHKTKILSIFAATALLGVVGCEGQGVGGSPAGANGGTVSSKSENISNQASKRTLPNFQISGDCDNLIPNYSVDISKTNPHLKTIKIVNNEATTMYAMVYQSDSAKNEYRIYVNGTKGIPGGCSGDYSRCTANVAIPQAMWRGGRVFISTEDLFSNSTFGLNGGTYTVDKSDGINKGDYIYRNTTAAKGVGLDSPSQLVEYTFDIANDPNKDFVGYNISYVDHLYLPIAMEDQQGMTGGYLGTSMSVGQMDTELNNFINGDYTCGYFSNNVNDCTGWGFFYTPDNNYLKLPGGYNYFAMANDPSNFNNSLKMIVARKVNDITTTSASQGNNNVMPDAIVKKWLGWVNPPSGNQTGPKLTSSEQASMGIYAKSCGTDDYCNKFADTVTKLWYAGYAGLTNLGYSKSNMVNSANISATDLVTLLIGYSFPTAFQDNPPIIYPNKDKYRASISYPESVKSILRGVPYPFYDYSEKTQWYPDPSGNNPSVQKYNLDPFVWFVHKKLGFAGYGFSIDDEISFVRVPQLSVTNPKNLDKSAGLTISIGGLNGIKIKKPYDAAHVEQLITGTNPKDSGKPDWKTISDTAGLTTGCSVPGSCNLAFVENGPQSTTVTLGIDGGSTTFTLTNSISESGFPLLAVSNCSVNGNLSNDVCKGIFPSKPQPWIVTTPPPIISGGGGNGKYTLYFPSGWTSIASNNCNLTGQNGINLSKLDPTVGGAANIDASNDCNFTLKDDNENIVVNMLLGVDTTNKQLTKVSNCTATKAGQPAQCNLPTFNVNGTPAVNLSIATPDGAVTAGGGGGSNTYTVYFAPDWGSMSTSSNGCSISGNGGMNINGINSLPGAATIKFNDTCSVNLTGADGSTFTLVATPKAVSCTFGNSQQCQNYSVTGQNINLPPPSALK